MAHIFREGLVMKGLLLLRKRRRQTQNLPQQAIIVGQMLQAIVVAIQRQSHNPQNQNVPQIQSRSSGGLLASYYLCLQQLKYLTVELRGGENPLQSRQHRWQLVPAPSRQHDSFDGGLAKSQLSFESFAHALQNSLGGILGQRMFRADRAFLGGF